jgi:murein DD-endopeptidase MepM/ murein hydrolase activator NlpD
VSASAQPPPAAGKPRRRWRKLFVRGTLLALLVLFGLWFFLTGPRDPDSYPPRESSPYRLPWPGGVTHLCVQGNRAVVSHRDREEHAYDFAMPVGSDVCAARGGVVVTVVQGHDGNGFDKPNNFVTVDHGDGTYGAYHHLKQGGSYVRVGQRVEQGERIAASGNVGRSMMPHLHFDVTDRVAWRTIPVTFADVPTDRGIPRMFKSYTSGNAPAPKAD